MIKIKLVHIFIKYFFNPSIHLIANMNRLENHFTI